MALSSKKVVTKRNGPSFQRGRRPRVTRPGAVDAMIFRQQFLVRSKVQTKPHKSTVSKKENPWRYAIHFQGFSRLFLVAGVGFEPTTFGLWARRATTAPPRDI